MPYVVDTNVLAYATLYVSQYAEESLRVLQYPDDIVVPDVCIAELANVAWKWVQHRGLSPRLGKTAIADARRFIAAVVPSTELWEDAFDLAIANDHAVYDMLFVTTALHVQSLLVTYDTGLIRKFPNIAVSPCEFHA